MLIDCNAYGKEPLEYDTVSEALGDNRIVLVTKLPDGRFRVEECCDRWYYADLTQDQLRAFGQELIDMANGKVTP